MNSKRTLEETKAKNLIKLRGYRLLKREELKNAINFTVKLKDGAKALIWVIPTERTVGVAYINQLKKAMNETEVERGIIVTSGRYSSSASKCKEKGNRTNSKNLPVLQHLRPRVRAETRDYHGRGKEKTSGRI